MNTNSSPNQNSASEHAVTQPPLDDSSGSLSRTRGDEVSLSLAVSFHKIQCFILSMQRALSVNRSLH